MSLDEIDILTGAARIADPHPCLEHLRRASSFMTGEMIAIGGGDIVRL